MLSDPGFGIVYKPTQSPSSQLNQMQDGAYQEVSWYQVKPQTIASPQRFSNGDYVRGYSIYAINFSKLKGIETCSGNSQVIMLNRAATLVQAGFAAVSLFLF